METVEFRNLRELSARAGDLTTRRASSNAMTARSAFSASTGIDDRLFGTGRHEDLHCIVVIAVGSLVEAAIATYNARH